MVDIRLDYGKPRRSRRRLIGMVCAMAIGGLGFGLIAPVIYSILQWRMPFLIKQDACLK